MSSEASAEVKVFRLIFAGFYMYLSKCNLSPRIECNLGKEIGENIPEAKNSEFVLLL